MEMDGDGLLYCVGLIGLVGLVWKWVFRSCVDSGMHVYCNG